jgi:DNA-binding response OmpR family regulator
MRKMEQKNRILIVEDDTDINNLLYTALQKAGYETVQAFSGTEASILHLIEYINLALIFKHLL